MAKCDECVHQYCCKYDRFFGVDEVENKCNYFKSKTDFVAVVRCKDCQYKEECWQKVDCEYSYKEIVYCSYGTRTPKEKNDFKE